MGWVELNYMESNRIRLPFLLHPNCNFFPQSLLFFKFFFTFVFVMVSFFFFFSFWSICLAWLFGFDFDLP